MRSRIVVVIAALGLSYSATARAEAPADTIRFTSELESGRVIPTSSTKQVAVTLQLLVPLTARSKVFAGIGPRAFTQELLTSAMPEILSLGMTSSFHAEF